MIKRDRIKALCLRHIFDWCGSLLRHRSAAPQYRCRSIHCGAAIYTAWTAAPHTLPWPELFPLGHGRAPSFHYLSILIVNFFKKCIYMSHMSRCNARIAAEPPQLKHFYANPDKTRCAIIETDLTLFRGWSKLFVEDTRHKCTQSWAQWTLKSKNIVIRTE